MLRRICGKNVCLIIIIRERLKLISAHDALVLLKNSLSASKLLHTLRTACCVDHELLDKFDTQLRSAVCSTCNASLTDDQWMQATFPVRNGNLDLRCVSSLASSPFWLPLRACADSRIRSCTASVLEKTTCLSTAYRPVSTMEHNCQTTPRLTNRKYGTRLGLLTVFKPKPKPRFLARTEENQNPIFSWA